MKTVIMIIGTGHSGSTVLDKSLGSHSQCFSLGEIKFLHQELIKKETNHCGCGAKLSGCDFWKQVILRIENKINTTIWQSPESFNLDLKLSKKPPKFRRMLNKLMIPLNVYNNTNYQDAITKTKFLYDTVIEESGKNILIDSSKEIFRSLILRNALKKDYNFFFIFLVRDGRGVTNSFLKKTFTLIGNGKNQTTQTFLKSNTRINPLQAILMWRNAVIKQLLLSRFIKRKNRLFIKYEDFATNPKKSLSHIADRLGLVFEENMIDFKDSPKTHMICGNPSRINAKKINRPTSAWNNLDSKSIQIFNKKAGWLNKYLGYK